jgi:hypothetical protein
MSECPACKQAESNIRTGHFNADCLDCIARSLAQSPTFFDSMNTDTITPTYRSALWAFFGEHWREGHEKVKQQAARLGAK